MYLNGRKKLKMILAYFNLSQHLLKGRSSSWSVTFGSLPVPAWLMRGEMQGSRQLQTVDPLGFLLILPQQCPSLKAFVLFWSCLIRLTIAYF